MDVWNDLYIAACKAQSGIIAANSVALKICRRKCVEIEAITEFCGEF